MNDPNFLAASAHFFGAYSVIMTANYLWGHTACLIAAGAFAITAAAKEFWYDAHYEIPAQTTEDNLFDFSTYMLGVLAAILMVFLVNK